MTQTLSSTRASIFRKIITLKSKQKQKIHRLRNNIKQLEKIDISITELSKLPKNRIRSIQEQKKKTVENIITEATNVKQISKEISSMHTQYLKLAI